MGKNKDLIRFIVEVGIFSAVGLVLDYVATLYSRPFWTQGGSISFAMVPIFIMGYRYGLKGGLVTGFIMGIIQILWGYVIGVGQAVLDYVFAYTCLGLVGIFKNRVNNTSGLKQILYIVLPILLVGILRTLSHTISGVIYFQTPFWASLLYNGPFMLISTPLCMIVVVVLCKRLPWFKLEKDLVN